MCDMTHSFTSHIWIICVTWLIHMFDMTQSLVTWLIHMCDMTHSYVWHDALICVRWHIHMNASCQIYEWVMSLIRHVTCVTWMNESPHMSHVRWCDHLTCDVNDMSQWHVTCEVTQSCHVPSRTHSYVWHDSSIYVTCLVHMCDSFICVTWRIRMCGMTHSYVWRDSFMYVTWLIHMCNVTHPHVWRDSSIHGTWLIYTCDTTHSYAWRDSFIRVQFLLRMRDIHLRGACATRLWVQTSPFCDKDTHPLSVSLSLFLSRSLSLSLSFVLCLCFH